MATKAKKATKRRAPATPAPLRVPRLPPQPIGAFRTSAEADRATPYSLTRTMATRKQF